MVRHRYGVIPDTDDADIVLDQVACCYVHMMWKAGKLAAAEPSRFSLLGSSVKPAFAAVLERLDLWCDVFAPDTSVLLRRDVCREAVRRPRLDNADECARRLRVTYEERTLLQLTTIGAIDADKRERARRRKARKLQRDRQRAARKRAARGAVSRAQYLAESLTATRPWEAASVSRRTWYRRNGTGASLTSTASMLGDGLVPPALQPGSRVIFLPRLPLSSRCSGTSFDDGPRRGKRAARAVPRSHAGDFVEAA
jgi:hypothetical protein